MRKESRCVFNFDRLLCFTKQCEVRIRKVNSDQKSGPVNHQRQLSIENPEFEITYFLNLNVENFLQNIF